MSNFPFLQLSNQFPSIKEVKSFSGEILTAFTTVIKLPNPETNLNIIVLIDLKTNKILKAAVSNKLWRSEGVISILKELLENHTIKGDGTAIHIPKQFPFSTKALAVFLLFNQFSVSLYSRPLYLPNIHLARVYFTHLVNSSNQGNLETVTDTWNSKVAPSVLSLISNIKKNSHCEMSKPNNC
jgi:hypothetical protein